jgi:hypothetical protein
MLRYITNFVQGKMKQDESAVSFLGLERLLLNAPQVKILLKEEHLFHIYKNETPKQAVAIIKRYFTDSCIARHQVFANGTQGKHYIDIWQDNKKAILTYESSTAETFKYPSGAQLLTG